MKRATLEATDENILQSIKEQNGTRNTEIKDFIEALELIEGNMFISLDARWGEGKTFYVRQIEKTLEYQTMKNFSTDDTQDELDKMKLYFTGTTLEEIDLKHSYLPVYYNAWLYDNHGDPLMSLLYVIVKKCGIWIDSKLTKDKTEKLKDLIKSVQVSLGMFSIGGDKVIDSFIEKDIFKDIQLAEDIRQKVKEIFNEIIEEQTQKLVIFIDELDRCKPSYALEMLERIKHYFDDDRIIFIVSVNKEQLIHTISNYYGNGFDSTGYLNKFFDLEAHLPELQTFDTEIYQNNKNQYFFISISNMLVRYFKLSRRDFLIYRDKINKLQNCNALNDNSSEGICISLFVPIIIILDMKNMEEKRKFLDGNSKFLEIVKMLPEGQYLYKRFVGEHKKPETIVLDDGSILTPLSKNSSVFNNDAHENLWSFANDPQRFIESMIQNPPEVPNMFNEFATNQTFNFDVKVDNPANYAEFYSEMMRRFQKDVKAEKIIQDMTLGQIIGKGSMSKYRQRF